MFSNGICGGKDTAVGRIGSADRALVSDGAASRLHPSGFDPLRVIRHIAEVANAIGWQAGVGATETAGSIVSFLAANPEHITPFLAGEESPVDWDEWLHRGCLTWHGMNGKIVTPEEGRRARLIRKMERGL